MALRTRHLVGPLEQLVQRTVQREMEEPGESLRREQRALQRERRAVGEAEPNDLEHALPRVQSRARSPSVASTSPPAFDSTRAPAWWPCRRNCSVSPATAVRLRSIFGSATNVPPVASDRAPNEAPPLQHLEGLPERHAADPDLFGQLSLGRQPVAGPEVAGRDGLHDPVLDLRVRRPTAPVQGPQDAAQTPALSRGPRRTVGGRIRSHPAPPSFAGALARPPRFAPMRSPSRAPSPVPCRRA